METVVRTRDKNSDCGSEQSMSVPNFGGVALEFLYVVQTYYNRVEAEEESPKTILSQGAMFRTQDYLQLE